MARKKKCDVQKLLEDWLAYLVSEYGFGKECTVEWNPMRLTEELFRGQDYILDGEVRDRTLYVYVDDPDEARRVLTHEYLEYVLDKNIIGRYVDLFQSVTDGMLEAFEKQGYKDKEAFIEVFVAAEERKREARMKNEKKTDV